MGKNMTDKRYTAKTKYEDERIYIELGIDGKTVGRIEADFTTKTGELEEKIENLELSGEDKNRIIPIATATLTELKRKAADRLRREIRL